MTHITQKGFGGFNQMMEGLFSTQLWKENMRFELEELARLRKWWPEKMGREIPHKVVVYRLNRADNCRRFAMNMHQFDRQQAGRP